MDWESFLLGAWGGIILSSMVFTGWYIFWLPRQRGPLHSDRGHVIYRKGQPPERIA